MTKQIERVIADGKPSAVIERLIKIELLKQDKAKFDREQMEAYEALGYWVDTIITPEELDSEGEVLVEEVTELILTEDMPTYEEYRDEVIITTVGVEATEDGPAILEVTELVRIYSAAKVDVSEYMIANYESLRAPLYPDAVVYLDAVVKGDKAAVKAYIDTCLAVKTKYPKA